MEEGQVYQSPTTSEQQAQAPYVYDEVFPALPESSSQAPINKCNNKMRINSSLITQVFRVPPDERRHDHDNTFGEKESMRTCSAIMKETGSHIEIYTSKDFSLTFLVTGKQDSVMEARRKILSTFQTQANSKIAVPKNHHRMILGKSGLRLKELEKKTATKISVPHINDPSEDIVVQGTRDGIEKAIHEIKVISDEQSKKASEKLKIPKHFHPFICGAYNETVNNLMALTTARIHIPPEGYQSEEITIAGEKDGVAAAKEKIMSMYAEMEAKYTTVGVEVNKNRHKYIIGPKRSGIAGILQATGVSVEMPPLDSTTETITLRGPQDKLGSALNMVYERANSVESAFVNAPSWIHKFIIGRKGANIKRITQDLSKVHIQFTDKENKITIEGPPIEVEQAYEKLKELTTEMERKLTYTDLTVDPKYYKHIIGKNGVNVNRIKEQTGVVINISEDENIIRIEGDKDGVAIAKQELEEMIKKMELEKEKDVIIDSKYHRALIGQKGEAIRETKDKFSSVSIMFPAQDKKSDIVKLRGPKEDVDKCQKYLQKKVKEIMESSYKIEMPAHGCLKYIVGKGGATIKRLRDETNTTIDIPLESGKESDTITIIGKQENVSKAKDMILKIQREQMNNVTEEVSIDPKMYNSLIGAGGKLIKSITDECGGVSIKFPTSDSKSDMVLLRGTKDDVKKAKKSLLEQASERELSNYTAEVRAKLHQHKYLIGKNGSNVNKIRESTGTRIIFPSIKDEDKEKIIIKGKQEGVEQAKAELEAAIAKLENTAEIELVINNQHHKHFVARKCEVLRQIENEFGGDVTISFPRNGISSDIVTIKGSKNFLDQVKEKMLDIVKDLEERITIDCEIPQIYHRDIMGKKGYKVQEIEKTYDVKIKIPDRRNNEDQQSINGDEPLVNGDTASSTSPNPCDIIKITGKAENCELAKEALKEREPITLEMEVPAEYHKAIVGPKGFNVKHIGNDNDVHIDVPSQDQPIDVIKIRGAPGDVENAKQMILEEMKKYDDDKEERRLKSFSVTIAVDPEFHPKIIGKKGAIISKIRANHGVQISLPKKDLPHESQITIQGYEESVLAAQEEILSIVRELEDKVKEEVIIDSRVHSRIIGSRGKVIKKIMDEFKVEIRFAKSGSSNPDLVIIRGDEDDVMNAKEHLLQLEEEYMQDVIDTRQEGRKTFTLSDFNNGGGGGRDLGLDHQNPKGFVVKGAPWEQNPQHVAAPDTASTQEFPSFGAAPASSAPTPSWGPSRR